MSASTSASGSAPSAAFTNRAAEGLVVTGFSVHDVRFPTNLTGDGTDAMNKSCDYSAAYLILYTGPAASANGTATSSTPRAQGEKPLTGYGMTFTIGRGNELCCQAIAAVVSSLLTGKDLEEMFADMGKTWSYLTSDSQLRWLGPETGVIHLATAAVVNALWDLFARSRRQPLWQLISSFTPEEFVALIPFRYITDALSPSEALEILCANEPGKAARVQRMLAHGYPAYTTSAGWSGYSDEKVARLVREALAQGFNHFKLKVGVGLEDDNRRLGIMRSIVDNPSEMPKGRVPPSPASIEGKNAGPTGCVVMIDSNQVFDVAEAVSYVSQLAHHRPWFIEEPTAPTDVLGHAAIRKALAPHGVGVATGEHCPNRMLFKQLLQADAVDVVQIDSCRLAGVNEVLAVMLMAKKFGKLVCPHAGGVGLCEYVQHLSMIDYVCIAGSHDRNVLEFVDHLHEHFPYPCKINERGYYIAPNNPDEGYSIEMHQSSIEDYSYPDGSYWKTGNARTPPPQAH